MRMTEFVLGRKPIRDRLARDRKVTVAVCQFNGSAGPWRGYVETTKHGKRETPTTVYRINVRLKPGVQIKRFMRVLEEGV